MVWYGPKFSMELPRRTRTRPAYTIPDRVRSQAQAKRLLLENVVVCPVCKFVYDLEKPFGSQCDCPPF